MRNTEKAASDDLSKKHDELIEQRTDSTSIEDKCTSAEKAVKRLETEISKLEPFVENYRKKLQLQGKLRLLERKLAILEFDRAEADYRMELKKMDTAMAEYKELEREINKGEGRINELVDKARSHKRNTLKLVRGREKTPEHHFLEIGSGAYPHGSRALDGQETNAASCGKGETKAGFRKGVT